MNQVKQWFSILQRKRFRAPNFADLVEREVKVLAFIDEWSETVHPSSGPQHHCVAPRAGDRVNATGRASTVPSSRPSSSSCPYHA